MAKLITFLIFAVLVTVAAARNVPSAEKALSPAENSEEVVAVASAPVAGFEDEKNFITYGGVGGFAGVGGFGGVIPVFGGVGGLGGLGGLGGGGGLGAVGGIGGGLGGAAAGAGGIVP